MKYFFILGSNPTLSIAELAARFKKAYDWHLPAENVCIFEYPEELAAEEINSMGGVIKFGEMLGISSGKGKEELKKAIIKLLEPGSGKFPFGISYYGKGKFNEKPLAMEIKKALREKGTSVRWVTSKDETLSSVVVLQNKLVSKGAEIILVEDGNKTLIGKTLAVQPFKSLSFRDYGRPARDDKSGMIPPKLAQIMINLSGVAENEIIYDPFCGSGTILTEAMLMGHGELIGSDVSEKAVSDTKKNIEWTKEKFQISSFKFQIFKSDVKNITDNIKEEAVNAIITEPYLGPQRGRIDTRKIVDELNLLYSEALKNFIKILKPGGRIVMVFPVFRAGSQEGRLSPNIKGLKIINTIPDSLKNNKQTKITNRNTIIYGREGQKVWREIVVLEK